MKKIIILVLLLILLLGVSWFIIQNRDASPTQNDVPPDPINEEEGNSVVIETAIDQGASALGEKVVPLELLEDSRCPSEVECVQAGTVRLTAELHSGLGVSEQIFELNSPITTEVNTFELVEVRPLSKEGEAIPAGDYTFVFKVTRRDI